MNRDGRGYTTGFTVFDNLFGEFSPGRIHLLVGRTDLNFHLLDRLGILSAEGGASVYYIDGTHRINPFSMAKILRAMRIDPSDALRRTRVSRAFTAHQMDTLVRISAPSADPPPDLLVVSAMDHLFSDSEVDPDEARGMLENCLQVLSDMSSKGVCVVLAAMGGGRGSDLLQVMSGSSSKWASLRNRGRGRIKIVTREGKWADFRPLPPMQTILDDFLDHAPEAAS
ncbi:MAG: hypothetical protein ACMUIG_00955 [Thermoplasmatota archaeon]